jgi:hypothetical protein
MYIYIYILLRFSVATHVKDYYSKKWFDESSQEAGESDPAVRGLEATNNIPHGGGMSDFWLLTSALVFIGARKGAKSDEIAPPPQSPPASVPVRADALYIKPFLYSNLLPDVVNLFS